MNFMKSVQKAIKNGRLSEEEGNKALVYAESHEGISYEWGYLVEGNPALVIVNGWMTPRVGFQRKTASGALLIFIPITSRLSETFF